MPDATTVARHAAVPAARVRVAGVRIVGDGRASAVDQVDFAL
jgi:hypothetical protein